MLNILFILSHKSIIFKIVNDEKITECYAFKLNF